MIMWYWYLLTFIAGIMVCLLVEAWIIRVFIRRGHKRKIAKGVSKRRKSE